MKLILANNQSERFVSFYEDLRQLSAEPFDYASYETLLFGFDIDAEHPVAVHSLATGRNLTDYDGVYLNGYLDTYELAATMATCCRSVNVPFVNHELAGAPSLSKLTSYAKLTAAGVRIPKTIAGAKAAIVQAGTMLDSLQFPVVLKRADADRGIDNYKVSSISEINNLLADHEARSLWIVQEFVDNDGFYLVSFYAQEPEFSIFRSLETRPDGDEQKAHMYKPKGGANASLLTVDEIPPVIVSACQVAMDVMNRQIGSVDCLFNPKTDQVHILEVNYNPQLVTIETFKEVRIKAFLEGISKIRWSN